MQGEPSTRSNRVQSCVADVVSLFISEREMDKMNTLRLNLKRFKAKTAKTEHVKPIDLSIPIAENDARMHEAFRWAMESLLTRNINKNDPRRVDFEHILDCLFLTKQKPNFNMENTYILLNKYFEFWYTLWCKREQYPHVLILLDRILINRGFLIRFIPEDKLDPNETISEYLSMHSGGIAIFDYSLFGIYSYEETYLNQKGYILMTSPFYTDFNPINILYSLNIISAVGLAWNKAKVDEAMEWCCNTEPALYYNREDLYMVVRYDPKDQEGRVNGRPSEYSY